jgi:iron(III) transport system permease protein
MKEAFRTIPRLFASVFDYPKYVLMVLLSSFVIYFIAYPLFQVLIQSVIVDGKFSLALHHEVFSKSDNFAAVKNSLIVACASTIFATIFGTILAFIVVRTDIPYKSTIKFLFLLPFAIPPLFAAMGWVQLIGPVGYVTRFTQNLFSISRVPWDIYSQSGIIFVMTVSMYPFVFLIVTGALQRMDSSLEEVARISGSSNFQIMRHITLPLVKTAILAGAVLAFIAAIDNFGIPAVLGMRVRYFVLTTMIYESLSIPNIPLATAMSMLLVILAFIAIYFMRIVEGEAKQYAVIGGKSIRPSIMRLGAAKPLVIIFIFFMLLFFVLLPLLSLFLTSFIKYFGAPIAWENISFDNYTRVLRMKNTVRAIFNSLLLAPLAATILIIAASLISYLHIKAKMWGASKLDTLGMVPYAMPGSVIGVAALLAWMHPPIGPSLYGTLWILLAAYVMRYMAFGLRSTRATLQQIDDSLEESAMTHGASRLRTLKDITFPLLKPGIVSGWILIFLPAFRELTVSILIWSSGSETIGVLTFLMQDAGQPQRAAVLASLVMPIILILYTVTEWMGGAREKK